MPPKKFSKAKAKASFKPKPSHKAKASFSNAKTSKFSKPTFSKPVRTHVQVVTKVVTVVEHRTVVVAPPLLPPPIVAVPSLPDATSQRVTIYVLELANGKYYVGKTARANVDERLVEHRSGQGSAWTRLHKPIQVAEVVPNSDPFDEDKVTMKCMLKYGMENVRGGSYTRIELLPSDVEAIERLLRGSTDKCFKCGRDGHFAAQCTGESSAEESKNEKASACQRCGREGHAADACYAKTHTNGADWGLRCGREGHVESSCYAKAHVTLGSLAQPTESQPLEERPSATAASNCIRCGRGGHAAESCYAKTHVNGANWCLRCGREGHEEGVCYAKTHASGHALSDQPRRPTHSTAWNKKSWRK